MQEGLGQASCPTQGRFSGLVEGVSVVGAAKERVEMPGEWEPESSPFLWFGQKDLGDLSAEGSSLVWFSWRSSKLVERRK